jgi:hypothetical protein
MNSLFKGVDGRNKQGMIILKILGWVIFPYVMVGMLAAKKYNSVSHGVLCGLGALLVCFSLSALASSEEIPTNNKTEQEIAQIKAEEQKQLAEIEETKKYGLKPSTSGWDGVAEAVDFFLRHNLNDPDSLKYSRVSGLVKTVHGDEECYVQSIEYRAKNGFGGYVRKSALFYVKNEVVIDYEEL